MASSDPAVLAPVRLIAPAQEAQAPTRPGADSKGMAHPTLPLTRDAAPTLTSSSGPAERAGRIGWLTVRRISVIVLLLGTAVLYLWGLSASGYANSFYSSAVLALAVLAGGAGPAAYAFNTVATPHQGSIVAGPVIGGAGSLRPGSSRAARVAGPRRRGDRQRRPGCPARVRRLVPPVGRGDDRVAGGRQLSAGQWPTRDGYRRVHRQRPEPDAPAVPG